jgi:pimeloyl-ACP methyl ester carboxylesterase/DNA-binding CsgD family transcriptional regulator
MRPLASATSALDLSQLIGLIYQTASDAACWETLLERMSATTAAAHSALADQALEPHFAQADRMLSEQSSTELGMDLLEQALNRIPLGMAIIDMQAKVLLHNSKLQAMLQEHPLWRLQRMYLQTQPASLLLGALKDLESGCASELPLRLGDAQSPQSVTLWLTRLHMPIGNGNGDAVLLIASDQHQALFALRALEQHFGLTPAEARLAQQLLLGLNTEEAAAQLGVSINTVRTHLKQVFAKCGIKRQAELMRVMYQSPMWLASGQQWPSSASLSKAIRSTKADDHLVTHVLRLPDGRRMAFVDRGDPHGIPLVFTRGILGSRLAVSPDESILWDKGIRLLVPDRPGSGMSDPNPGHTLLTWTQDVHWLAQHLGITRWHLMGFATGAAYALACAYASPQQVASALLVGAAPEIHTRRDLQWFRGALQHGLMLCRYAPALVQRIYGLLTKNVERRAHQYFNDTLSGMPAVDQDVFTDSALRHNEAQALLEGTAQGNPTFLNEMCIAASAWGFAIGEIASPLSFWHGQLDPYVSWKASEKMAAQCKDARFHLVPDGGQYLIFSHWEPLLDEVCRLHQQHPPSAIIR